MVTLYRLNPTYNVGSQPRAVRLYCQLIQYHCKSSWNQINLIFCAWYCCALCKFPKRFFNSIISYGQTIFPQNWVYVLAVCIKLLIDAVFPNIILIIHVPDEPSIRRRPAWTICLILSTHPIDSYNRQNDDLRWLRTLYAELCLRTIVAFCACYHSLFEVDDTYLPSHETRNR